MLKNNDLLYNITKKKNKFVCTNINIMKKIVVGILLLLIGLFFVYKFVYHEHRDISNEKAVFTVSVPQLLKEYVADETKANAKYLDKSIIVKGKITSVDMANKAVVIDEKVFVILTNLDDVKANSEVAVQGRLIGYDSLLEEIKIDQAQIK
jgi:hypothetical protein